MSKIVHMIGVKAGLVLPLNSVDVQTRCGIVACPSAHNGPSLYKLSDEHGNEFLGTTRRRSVTCKKCVSLLTSGTLQPTRAGPPTPRGRPWRADEVSHREKALTFGQGNPGAYEARSAAWEAYYEKQSRHWTPLVERAEKDGFFAGFAACLEFSPKVPT